MHILRIADVIRGVPARVLTTTARGATEGVLSPQTLERQVLGFTVDSRHVSDDQIFVALPGQTHDGHEFLGQAFKAGALGALVSRIPQQPLPANRLLFLVADTLQALQTLASAWRASHSVTVVGVTGSVGKTTVKEAIAHALGSLGETSILKSEANLNTEIGLPLELLRLDGRHRVAVLEMGMYQPGDIALLSAIAKPQIGVVTNVQSNHLERTGSIERTARGKSELVQALPPDGLAVLNGDDPLVQPMRYASSARTTFYGTTLRFDFVALETVGRGRHGFATRIVHGGRGLAVDCPTPGTHNALNLLPAAAVAHHLGIPWTDIGGALSTFRMESRARFLPGPKGSSILDDRYNASPASMIAALQLLSEEPGRHLALLGEMLELGQAEETEHRRVGRAAAATDLLILIGARTRWIADEAVERGLPQERVLVARDNEQAAALARDFLGPGDTLLVKGSRGLRLEEVVGALASA